MKVLLPLDGSELSEVALAYAKELVGTMKLELILFHVCKPGNSEMVPIYRSYIQQHVDALLRDAKVIVKKYGADKDLKTVDVEGKVVVGYPAEQIIKYATDRKVNLILMATHGSSGVKQWAMGSVADKVLHASTVPVWLVRPDMPKGAASGKMLKRNLLVPLDGSKLAESVLPYLEIAAKHRGAELIEVELLFVCEPPMFAFDYSGPGKEAVEESVSYSKKLAKEYLAIVKKRLEKLGIAVQTKIIVGKPDTEIVNYANANPSKLIVIATHGRSGFGKFTYGSFGSVAQKVLHEVTGPMLIVRPTQK
jgi:nucleotide-binding universal stress UspA family protein